MLKLFDFIKERVEDAKSNSYGSILAKKGRLTRQLVVLDRFVVGGILVDTGLLVTRLFLREIYLKA